MHLGLVKDPMEETPEERVLKSYFDRLVAYSVERSRVIAIEFQSENSDLAAQAANAVAEGYLVLQQAAKQDQSRAASQWLAGEIETLRKKVAEAESKVEQYRASTNLFVGTNNTTLSNQQLGDVNAQLSAARAQKADAEAKARIIRESLRSGGPGRILRYRQFRIDAAAVGATRHLAGPVRRAVLHAARPTSAHQGVARSDRGS